MSETKRLGRGLEALLGSVSREQAQASGALRELPVNAVIPNHLQPRAQINEADLLELSASIEASVLLQPVLVRPHNGKYELIAGERRWRAVQRLGWPKIPAVVKEVDDQTLLTLALIENLQRDDLTAIDEAAGYQRLSDEFKLAQANLRANIAQGRGNNFRYYGPGTGTSPLPITLAYARGINPNDPNGTNDSNFGHIRIIRPIRLFVGSPSRPQTSTATSEACQRM
jgi:ParB/RepB/Spo0J family partition protein